MSSDLKQPNPNREVPSMVSNSSAIPNSSSRCECRAVERLPHRFYEGKIIQILDVVRCARCLNQDAEIHRQAELIERLKQEAQIWAQEARTANATLAEIYQLCSGAKGEQGNWNGANPVRARFAEKDAEILRLTQVLDSYVCRAEQDLEPKLKLAKSEIARLTQELAWAKDEHHVQSETIEKYQEEQKRLTQELAVYKSATAHGALEAVHLSEALNVAEEFIASVDERSLSDLKNELYFEDPLAAEDDCETFPNITRGELHTVRATIAKLRGEK